MSARITWIRVAVHVLAMLPLLQLVWITAHNQLGPDPAQHLVHELGFWGIVILWCSLAMTPLRLLFGQPFWVGLRRPLGLWSFAYICLHLIVFIVAWCGLDVTILSEEVLKRPYIMLGVTAWVLMVPLAVTSTQSMRRKLGRKWITLHRLVYLIAILAFVHMTLAAKLEYVKPLALGILLIFLFFIRLRARQARTASIKCAPSA